LIAHVLQARASGLRENPRVVVKRSATGYAATVTALIDSIERRGLTVFARIDHAAGAREVGLELADEQAVVFGNARAGTPLMQSDPRVGIELPLRMLVWSDGEGALVGYLDPRELGDRYELAAHESTLEQMAALLAALAADACASTQG
jgi:uncharacterized protein (DUF302 family)